VMVTAYCYGRRTHTCPRQKGSFLAIFQYGGASAALRHRLARKKVCRVCGSHAGGVRQWAESPVSAGLCWMATTQKVGTFVRTRFAGLHPGHTKMARDENSILARVCS
jgi:hypothetical protein